MRRRKRTKLAGKEIHGGNMDEGKEELRLVEGNFDGESEGESESDSQIVVKERWGKKCC